MVDGCKDRSSDPGAKEMDWLDVQLSEFRDRGMQVWMSGHVPPHMGHYFDNCCEFSLFWLRSFRMPHCCAFFQNVVPADWSNVLDLRYGDLALRYQDTIVGHLFGHMSVSFSLFDVNNFVVRH